jgi:plastocyanin
MRPTGVEGYTPIVRTEASLMTTRRRQLIRLGASAALLALGLLAAPSVSAGNPCFHDFTMPPASSEATNEIKLLPCAFAPTVARVDVGSEVTFFNGPNFSHLVTGANQAWGSPEVELQPGQKVSYTFDTAGIYPFACVLHPGMSGAIVVGDVAAASGAGTMTGGSTGASTGGGSNATDATDAAATGAAADISGIDRLLVAVGIVGAVVAGAIASWFAFRRRSIAGSSLTPSPSPRER